jgi:hypothetical protein
MSNNNPDLSTIPGSAAHQEKTAQEISKVVTEIQAKTTPPAQGATGFQLPEGYNPLHDPRVKQHNDTLFSQLAGVQSAAAEKEKVLADLKAKVDAFENEKKEASRKNMTESQLLADKLKDLEASQTNLLQALANSESKAREREFEIQKRDLLTASGIPTKYHDFVAAGAKSFDELQGKIVKAQEIFKDVKVETAAAASGQVRTETVGATAPTPANGNPGTEAAQTVEGQSILDRLTPEQRANVNFDTLKDVIRGNPAYIAAMQTNFKVK